MKKILQGIIILFIVILLVSCDNNVEKDIEVEELYLDEESKDNLTNNLNKDSLEKLIDSLTINEKIGQLMIVGYSGDEYNEEIDKKIKEIKPGGIIFFSENLKTVDEANFLLNKIKKVNSKNKIPLFLAIDEEGGEVSRLPKELKKIPSAKKIASHKDENLAFEFAYNLGNNMSELGFNLNFAPMADLRLNPESPITRNRSFSDDKFIVEKMTGKFLEGLKEAGVVATIKHFPGHGDTNVDSHYSLPIINKNREELLDEDIYPFKKAIENNVPLIMVNHVFYPQIDPKYQASASKIIIEDLLREELKYRNIIISDDMTMGAITNSYEPEEAGLEFIMAGGDMVIFAHGEEVAYKFIEKLKNSIEDGSIKEEDINKKVYRILSIKKNMQVNNDLKPEVDINTLNKEMEKIYKKME